MIEKFDKPLEEWIEEEVEVPAIEPVVDEKGNITGIKKTTKKATQRTMYSRSTPRQVICTDHEYICLDRGKYHFKCIKCDWNKIAHPITFKYNEKTRKLTYRENGMPA